MNSRTSVEPVKATLSIPPWMAMAAPAVDPNPGTMLTTPGGNSAWEKEIQRADWSRRSESTWPNIKHHQELFILIRPETLSQGGKHNMKKTFLLMTDIPTIDTLQQICLILNSMLD